VVALGFELRDCLRHGPPKFGDHAGDFPLGQACIVEPVGLADPLRRQPDEDLLRKNHVHERVWKRLDHRSPWDGCKRGPLFVADHQ
jgi:hypothetical protein